LNHAEDIVGIAFLSSNNVRSSSSVGNLVAFAVLMAGLLFYFHADKSA
jgi:hypothetical protein